jgi:hypothetical protein
MLQTIPTSTPTETSGLRITNPLSVMPNPSGIAAIRAGESFTLSVTLRNQGRIGAILNVYIDETSQPFRQWCASPAVRLAIDTQQSTEVTFQFVIPVQTLPGTYPYLLIVDAPEHYPEETPILHQSHLQVLPPSADVIQVNDPTFGVHPPTSVAQPAILQPGIPQEISIRVHNRSTRVDRFRLLCSDLTPDWYRIVYPVSFQDLGLVTEADSLALNPGAQGDIRLQVITPPQTDAGRYLATLQLLSLNHPNLMMMEILYLQVSPVYNVQVEMHQLIGSVQRQPGSFQIQVKNQGNAPRMLTLQAKEHREKAICTYSIEPTGSTASTPLEDIIELKIGAKETQKLLLAVEPTRRRARPWWGKGKEIEFYVDVLDRQHLPVSQEVIEGSLRWEARPWWHLALIMAAGLGAIASLVLVIWWCFFRPPIPAKVMQFESDATTYQSDNHDFIYLNWEISQPNQIASLRLTGQADNGAASEPITYSFQNGVPPELKNTCVLKETLLCHNVRTDASKAGNYQFQLAVVSKQEDVAPLQAETRPVAILPAPLPQVVEFRPTQPNYVIDPSLSGKPTGSNPTDIRLNWRVSAVKSLQALELVGRSPEGSVNRPSRRYSFAKGIPSELAEYCKIEQQILVCKNIPTQSDRPGQYIFELSLITAQNPEAPTTKKTDLINIIPRPQPTRILQFQVNGQPAPLRFAFRPTSLRQITLSWKITGGMGTRAMLNPTPGSIPLEGSMLYPLSAQSSETLTLEVITPDGQKIERSLIIEPLLTPPPLNSPAPKPAVSPQAIELPKAETDSPPPFIESAPASPKPDSKRTSEPSKIL